jgi:hypothetical protein
LIRRHRFFAAFFCRLTIGALSYASIALGRLAGAQSGQSSEPGTAAWRRHGFVVDAA